jgi:hypothetical protein
MTIRKTPSHLDSDMLNPIRTHGPENALLAIMVGLSLAVVLFVLLSR